jgi:hypothetical protein
VRLRPGLLDGDNPPIHHLVLPLTGYLAWRRLASLKCDREHTADEHAIVTETHVRPYFALRN